MSGLERAVLGETARLPKHVLTTNSAIDLGGRAVFKYPLVEAVFKGGDRIRVGMPVLCQGSLFDA